MTTLRPAHLSNRRSDLRVVVGEGKTMARGANRAISSRCCRARRRRREPSSASGRGGYGCREGMRLGDRKDREPAVNTQSHRAAQRGAAGAG